LKPEDQTSESNEGRIQTAVNNQLGSKGYKLVSQNPDFSIVAKVATKDEYWYGSGYYGYRYSHKIEAGTLLLDFVIPREYRLIWRGEAAAVHPLLPKNYPSAFKYHWRSFGSACLSSQHFVLD
jgi:hypothetical protein